jgi:hypothetical protein
VFGFGILFFVGEQAPTTETRRTTIMSDFDFEIIEETQITRVPRGRKSNIDPAMVDAFRALKKGKAVRITSMKLDPKAPTYKTDKARVSASLRSAIRRAGHEDFAIEFSPEGVPQVRLK